MSLFKPSQEKLDRWLFKALDRNYLHLVQKAIDAGADVNSQNKYGTPVFRFAVRYCTADICHYLLENGTPVNGAAGFGGMTDFLHAVNRSMPSVAMILLDRGASIHEASENGRTALHIAAEDGDMNMVKLLLSRGADIKAVDSSNNTPADVAAKKYPGIRAALQDIARQTVDRVEEQWNQQGDELTYISDKPDSGFRITQIFNFSACTCLTISRHLETGQQSQSFESFSHVDEKPYVRQAAGMFEKLGGVLPHAPQRLLSKAAPPQKPAARGQP